MLDRRACERRVYRLAALLSGKPNAAAQVIQAVLDAQPNLRKLSSTRMDRLTVLRAREIEPGSIVDDRVPRKLADALANVTPQQREAWVFVHVYKVPMREAARAMDCSVTAMTQHMTLANEAMERAISAMNGDTTQDDAAAIFRGWTMSIDVPAFVRREQERKRRFRLVLIAFGVVVAIAVVVAVIALVRTLEGAAGTGEAASRWMEG